MVTDIACTSIKPAQIAFDTSLSKYLPSISSLSDRLTSAINRVLRLPSVGSKSFLITIGNRSITDLIVFVTRWSAPVVQYVLVLFLLSPSTTPNPPHSTHSFQILHATPKVGCQGKLGRQVYVLDVKVNLTNAVARGDLMQKIEISIEGGMLTSKSTVNLMVDYQHLQEK
ncbi:hypothetical protein H2248_008528 [Termitomyces sp. 'cryptogamus']|nr:hypothetical protein H2248_008528 [Termitomyces sp. 'cryptogamus']